MPTQNANPKKPKELNFFRPTYKKIWKKELNLTNIGKVNFRKMTIGLKIKSLREEAGMLQRELAYKLNVGDAFISKVERNQKVLKKEHLKTLSELFKISYSELETLWMASKVLYIVQGEEKAIDILKVAEKELKYGNKI